MATLEFDATEFLEYFDDSFMICVDDSISKKERNDVYNQLKNEIEKFVLSVKEYDIITGYIEVDEIEFMLSIFEIIEAEDTKNAIDIEKFLKQMQKFSKRYRNITKTLDTLNSASKVSPLSKTT